MMRDMKHDDDERDMMAFLVGSLDTTDRDRVNTELASDEHFFERLEAFEDDFILRWHRGQLSPADQEQFERAYNTAPRRARVEAALGLIRAVAETRSAPAPEARGSRIQRWFAASYTVPRWAVGAVSVVTMALLVGLASSAVSQPDGGKFAVALTAVGERSAGGAAGYDLVRLSSRYSVVELNVLVPPAPGEQLSAEIRDIDTGAAVTIASPEIQRSPGDDWIGLAVPASDLPAGDFVITVSRRTSAGSDVVARQAFRVFRQP